MTIAKLKVFSHEIHEIFGDELEALAAIKQLKYFYNLPLGQLFCALAQLYKPNPNSAWWKAATDKLVVSHWSSLKVCDFLKDYVSLSFLSVWPTVHFHVFFQGIEAYNDFALDMEANDPHAVFPTNIYRQCDGYTVSTKDCSTIESVMSTTLTTTIKIRQRLVGFFPSIPNFSPK